MFCYQFNSAAYPIWFSPYVTWQGDICKYATCGDSQACYYKLLQRNFVERYQKLAAMTLVVFCHYPVDFLYAILEFLDLFPNNSKHSIVYFGGHCHNTD